MNNLEYIVFGKKDCPYCVKAKEILIKNNIPHEFYDINNHLNIIKKNEYLNNLYERGKIASSTVPKVFKKNDKGEYNFIGGSMELISHLKK